MNLWARCCAMRRSWRCCWLVGPHPAGPAIRPVLHHRQSAQPGPADGRGRAGRLAMTFIIVTGGIDLSVGSIFGSVRRSCSACSGRIWACPCPSPWSPRCWSAASRAWSTASSSRASGVPPLIATLATLALYRGLAEGISQARSVRGYPDWFFVFGQGELLGVPTPALAAGRRGRRRRRHARPHHLRPDALCHRQQRDGRALLRPAGRPGQAGDLSLLRPGGGARRRRSSSRASPPPARTWARGWSSTSSPPWCWAGPRSSAAAARSSAPRSAWS